ncbi:MAG TPA: NAD-dependent malic enzyme [Gemmatimonadales bacterium]
MTSTKTLPSGVDLLRDPHLNKGTAFTEEERDALGLRGLLPPRVFTQDQQISRILENYHRKTSDIEKYIYLVSLQDRNEALFYRVLIDHVAEMMPIIYTPTVGQACQLYGHIYRRPNGMYITANDRGRVARVLRNWQAESVSIIVVTDGERILGLGDLGASGMGIPIGKLSLYSALAGIHPDRCLPVTLDVGTENTQLLDDPLYTGLTQRRLRGAEYAELVEEFVAAVQEFFPGALIQFEDFATQNALGLLERYRNRVLCFNDDIQGTAAVTLAGVVGALRITATELRDQRILFYGAGSAATGIANLFVSAMMHDGVPEAEARARCWFVDSKGLVVASRSDLAAHKQPYAHDHAFIQPLEEVVQGLRPTVLIGVSGQAQTFTEPVVRAMAASNDRPIIFALSNPTANSECTAQQAYAWTDGRVVFASGSPFGAVDLAGRRFVPGQGNNAYIFPGVGLGVIASGATRVTDEMFYAAARSLSKQVSQEMLDQGSVYPPLEGIRQVSAAIATAVAEEAYASGVADGPPPADLLDYVRGLMYQPAYESYL